MVGDSDAAVELVYLAVTVAEATRTLSNSRIYRDGYGDRLT